ncbi:hypothetical protein Tco_0369549, partial [Tanacetum coccineum]
DHGFPVVTFIDIPWAFADLKSEELGQADQVYKEEGMIVV